MHLAVQEIHKGSSLITLSIDHNNIKRAVLLHRDASMVQQIRIIALVNAAMGINKFHLAL